MIELYQKKEKCCGCTACMNICPHTAIQMTADEEGFLYPEIDPKLCVECGACVKVCAFHKKSYAQKIPSNQDVYALKHSVEGVRKKSTSGGAFTAISDYILEHKGVIYGAVFDDKFKVLHFKAVNKDQRDLMRGSKYVQSHMGSIFNEIRADLINGRLVLFTGTPCQIGGLKSYLGKEYDNLILCDIACHGVPSPKVWEDYKSYLEERFQDKIKKVNFRSKEKGWKNSSILVDLNQNKYIKSMQDDPYYILFFSHLSLRPSCHECVYTSFHRSSDFTMADFWGIEYSAKEFYDKNGVSLLLVNTQKGKELLHDIEGNLELLKSSHAEFYQPIFEAPSKASPKREAFWKEYHKNGREVIVKYGKLSSSQVVIKKLIVPFLKVTGLYKYAEKKYFGKSR